MNVHAISTEGRGEMNLTYTYSYLWAIPPFQMFYIARIFHPHSQEVGPLDDLSSTWASYGSLMAMLSPHLVNYTTSTSYVPRLTSHFMRKSTWKRGCRRRRLSRAHDSKCLVRIFRPSRSSIPSLRGQWIGTILSEKDNPLTCPSTGHSKSLPKYAFKMPPQYSAE